MARVKVWVCRFPDRANLQLQWIDPETGRRKTKSAGTADEGEAEEARVDLESDLRNGRYQEPTRLTWERFRELYADEVLPGLRPRSREKIETVLTVFEEIVQPQRLAGVDVRAVSRFVKGMRERRVRGGKIGLAAVTQRNYLVELRSALAWAKDQGFIAAVPPVPALTVPKKKPQPIPAEAFERLLAAAPSDEWKAFLQCGWLAGLRLSEANELRRTETERWPWLDLERDRIILPAAFAKADEDQWVPVHPTLKTVLESLPVDGDRVFSLRSESQRSRGELLTRSGISTAVIQMARAAGVRLSIHRLRKGFGCRMAAALGKGGAAVLHEMMRHSSMQVTMDFYANVDGAKAEAIKLLS